MSTRDMLILGGLLAAAAVLYFVLLVPAARERTRLTAEAEQLTKQSKQMQKVLKAAPARKGTKGNPQARLEEIRGRLLPPGGLPRLLAEISRPSQRHGVRIVSFTPKESGREISVDLVLEGTFLQLGRYLEDLLKGPYVLAVAKLQLRANQPGDTRLRMKLTLKSWMQESS